MKEHYRPQPYTVLSRWPKGTYGWAMDQISGGNDVRRLNWPIEKWSASHTAIWRVYRFGENGGLGKGFNPGVCGADNDAWGDLGTDSMGYRPSIEDKSARDWQLVKDVTQAQIDRLDADRMVRYPNAYGMEYAAWQRKRERFDVSLMIGLAVGGIILMGLLFT
jgi:hypothetical protein